MFAFQQTIIIDEIVCSRDALLSFLATEISTTSTYMYGSKETLICKPICVFLNEASQIQEHEEYEKHE
jgi:hypothetical protein